MNQTLNKLKYFSILFCVAILHSKGYAQTMITSFEDQKDMQKIYASEGVDFSRSTDFTSNGAFSCKAIFPANGGTLSINNIETIYVRNIESSHVSQAEVILYFLWTNETANISLIVEDSLDQTFTKQFILKKGANHVQLSLNEAKKVDLSKIKSIGLHTDKKHVFYIDYITLDQYQPVLEKLGRWDVEYSTEIKTSHYPWGSELVSGPIESYSISPVFDGRGIIELAQRLDLDFQVTTLGRSAGAEKYGFGDFYMRRSPGYAGDSTTFNLVHRYIAEDLLFSPEFDVIIWPGIHAWESYPAQIRNALLERVRKGTGLVLLYPISDESNSNLWEISPLKSTEAGNAQSRIKDAEISMMPDKFDTTKWVQTKAHYITRGIAFEAFPWGNMGVYPYQKNQSDVLIESSKGNPVLAVSNYGKGRVVAMAYPERGFLPRVDDPWETGLNYAYWEYMWSLVARSVVWVSDREPETFIKEAIRTTEGLTIKLENVIEDVSVNVQVLDDFGAIEEEISTSLRLKQTQLDIKFSKTLHGGKHLVNIQLKGDRGVYDWYSFMFSTGKIAEIVSVEKDKSELSVGEKVKTSVVVKADDLMEGMVTARLFDNYGRLVDEIAQEITIDGEEKINIVLNSENILTNLGKSDYILYVNGNQTDHKTIEHFFMQSRIWDDYDVTMYHFGPNPLPGVWPAVDRQLQELNVTTLAAYTLSNSKHANYKVQAQTRIKGVESPDSGPDLEYYKEMKAKYLETHDKSVLKRKYGLKDSVYLNSVREDLMNKLTEWKKFSPSAYYIYEEPSVTRYNDALDLCFRKSTLEAMRNWLKEEYVSLKALNEQWGTHFTQWQDVIPDDSREAIERGNYSSWADHRTFMEICWADQFKFVQDIVNEIDPGGLVQLSGTQSASSHNGYDYSRLNKYVGQMNPYDIDNQLEYHHNFNPDLKISGQAGYGALGKGVLYDYYNHLFLKETGGSYIFWQVSNLNPDLRFCQSGVDLKAGFDEILKRGIGRLISSYEPENELKIAVHFSYPSVHASWIVDGKIAPGPQANLSNTLQQFNRNRDGWVKILHDTGQGFGFISYSDIENGSLVSNGYKVLILPMSYALSDKEVQQIEIFVKQGGIVIADALPGVMDDHTKFRSKRELAEVFGIEARTYSRDELVTPKGESKLKITKASVLANWDGRPQFLYNEYGSGRAYLLNYFMDSYTDDKLHHNTASSLMKIRKLFDKENLKSSITLTASTGDPADGVEKYSFSENGSSTRLLGLLPGKTGDSKEINLHVDKSVHLYDIRNHKYLGEGNDFKINIKASVPELFGLVQGTIDHIKVIAPPNIVCGEKVILDFEVEGKGLRSLKSTVHIDVYNPDGKKINYYSGNCDLINSLGRYSFNTALDDPSGYWKIRLTETISGLEKVVLIAVN